MESDTPIPYRAMPFGPGTILEASQAMQELEARQGVKFSHRQLWQWLRDFMSLDLDAPANIVKLAEVPVWLARLHDIGGTNDKVKLMIGSFCQYYSDFWNEPTSSDDRSIGDRFATELEGKMGPGDRKAFLAKLYLVADTFNFQHPMLVPANFAVGCTCFFIDGVRPANTRSPRVMQTNVSAKLVNFLKEGSVPPTELL